ncbi:MAG: preprotein translocase subunit SecY [Candidatus Liptonbacteria bacterium RIFCSPLOWO2_01_FULL_56_20]|uniref:Protein translocase subunit SecY n=1 Tax=Candidatus Liptonbacteria bacterium RIFCSPLOWO2_01_FULL_56_20 TaxID=1798652 RepID=A0A1G2CJH7_9BACT|nr:MAG: preprotein translocase subunit SecY [Candidatus Liptonbacteria bacterium RIFCSPHIGHO2_01_FULL_56_18b]OGZ01554.1 MAG: preprotein translocase subunit SecY [Candidatus Liptonbacteria bacterium RIFCSPLOWO2_01_FULL_56_20]
MNRFLQIFKVKDLRKKVLIVVGLLVAFRLLAAIPIPGVDAARLEAFFGSNQLLGFLNLFSGGGLENLSVAMLGVGPYITATIIMQLLTIIFPKFKQMYYEEGSRGQAKFNQYSRMLTVPLALLQAYGFLNILVAQNVIDRPSMFSLATNVLAIAAGSMITLWLGELVSEQKIGNGVSLIILAGIVSRLPQDAQLAFASYTPSLLPTYIGFLIVLVLLVAGVVYLNEGERKIPITYARRVRGIKMYGGASSYLPLKVNQAGMIPLIFAISVLLFPQFLAQITSIVSVDFALKFNELVTKLLNNRLLYGAAYFILVVVFTYFYTAITFNPEELSKNLQRSGGFVPGIRPGEATAQFFAAIVNRVTFFGATFLGLVAVLPLLIQSLTGLSVLTVSGTALLIVVAVALETMRQINSQLTVREYEGIE